MSHIPTTPLHSFAATLNGLIYHPAVFRSHPSCLIPQLFGYFHCKCRKCKYYRNLCKAVPRFGEFCNSCCLPLTSASACLQHSYNLGVHVPCNFAYLGNQAGGKLSKFYCLTERLPLLKCSRPRPRPLAAAPRHFMARILMSSALPSPPLLSRHWAPSSGFLLRVRPCGADSTMPKYHKIQLSSLHSKRSPAAGKTLCQVKISKYNYIYPAALSQYHLVCARKLASWQYGAPLIHFTLLLRCAILLDGLHAQQVMAPARAPP